MVLVLFGVVELVVTYRYGVGPGFVVVGLQLDPVEQADPVLTLVL